MRIKTNTLTGAILDWAVGKCEGKVEQGVYGTPELRDSAVYLHYCDATLNSCYSPSTDWSQAGPIIEREKIETRWIITDAEGGGYWQAANLFTDTYGYTGVTSLIAAMRCYVASKLTNEIEVPDELIL